MIVAALQLEQSFLTRLEIKYSGGSPAPKGASVNIQARTGIAAVEEPTRWKVDLDVDVRGEEGQPPPPYLVGISLSGIVRITAQLEGEAGRKLAFVNGLSMLYSAARETILLLTGRYPAGPWVLPTLSFVDEYDRLTSMGGGEAEAKP